MRSTQLVRKGILTFAALVLLSGAKAMAQATNLSLAGAQEQVEQVQPKVSVFFGTVKALDVAEIRTNALIAVRAKGHAMPDSSYCVINVKVQGNDPGCAVIFWDFEAKTTYQVLFNARGEVTGVTGGAMQHGGPLRQAPRPKMPEGGVRVNP